MVYASLECVCTIRTAGPSSGIESAEGRVSSACLVRPVAARPGNGNCVRLVCGKHERRFDRLCLRLRGLVRLIRCLRLCGGSSGMRSGSKISSRNTSGSSGVSASVQVRPPNPAPPTRPSPEAAAQSRQTPQGSCETCFPYCGISYASPPSQYMQRKQADRTGSFCAKQKEKTVCPHFPH